MRKIGMAVWVLLVIALAGLPAGMQAEGADDGLVAEWRFEEGSGSVLVDSSGNGNDGVIHGATWVEGKYGKALSFDGVDDYISLPRIFMNTPSQISVEGWFETTSDSHMMFFSFGGCYVMYMRAWRSDPSGALLPLFDRSSRGDASWGSGYNDGYWHHFVAVNDGSKTTLYVDGFIVNSRSETLFDISSINTPYVLGSQIPGAPETNRFDGIIDEVRIYNRALTSDEIKSHYEGKQTAIALTKSATPHSIKQGQTTTVTLTVTNTGTTEVKDIEVADTIPSDLIFIDGETSKTYTSLRPKDSREFQYVLQPSDAGTFNLDPATATYSDEEGNYHTAESKTATITVIPSTNQPATPKTAPKSSTEISTASVHLHGEKTDVVLGEDVLLKLSAVNIIGNPLMRVQVIIIPPSGWSVTSSEFAKSGAGQYTTTYDIKEGVGRDIEVRIMPNQIGDDFQVQGRIIYYFGDDSDAREDHTLTLPITVRAEAENGQGAERTADTSGSEEAASSTPGFAAVVAVAGVLAVYLRRRRR